MRLEKNKIESKLERKRKIISFFLTILLHLIFIFILIISGAFKLKKEEIKVIKVQLHDKIIEEFNNMDEGKKEKIIQQSKKKYETLKKKEQKSKETIKKDSITKEESIKEEKIKKEEENIYETYKKKVEEEKKKAEEDFFKDSKKQDSSGKDDNIDNLFNYNIDDDNNKKSDGNDKGSESGNIKWEGGSSRRLVLSDKIKAPEEISEKGLKLNLTIRFTVNNNGFIEKVTILESTGNILWDNYIIEQFKKKYIFEKADFYSTGILEITINY